MNHLHFNPIIVLFLTAPYRRFNDKVDIFQSYYSLISNLFFTCLHSTHSIFQSYYSLISNPTEKYTITIETISILL